MVAMAETTERKETGARRHRVVYPLMWALLVSALLAGAAIAAVISYNRGMVIDEASELHTAYNRLSGKRHYRDFLTDQLPVYPALITPLVTPDDPVASVRRARGLSLLVFLLILALAAFYARRVGGATAAGLTIASLLVHSTFVERIIEIRPEGLAMLLVLIGLALETSSLSQLRRFSLQALSLGLATILCTQAIAVGFGFVILWLNAAIGQRRARLLTIPVLVSFLPFAIVATTFAASGGLGSFLSQAVTQPLASLVHGIEPPVPLMRYLWREAPRNLVFCALSLVVLVHSMRQYLRGGEDSCSLLHIAIATALLVFAVISPRPFPPTHLLPILILSLMIARSLSRLLHNTTPIARLGAVLIYIVALGITSMPRLLHSLPPSIRLQLDTLRLVHDITAPTDTVLDFAGLYFRPDAYPQFSMNESAIATYGREGKGQLITALRKSKPVVFLRNYRTHWLPEADRQYLREHLAHYWGYLFLQGIRLKDLKAGDTLDFEVWRKREFKYSGPGKILVDGQPFQNGILSEGLHRITASKPVQNGRLIMTTKIRPPSFYAPLQPLFTHFD